MGKKGEESKRMLLAKAMRLFTRKPYAEVTFAEIERLTGLSRGAIMYHVNNKESLFRESMEMFVFHQNSLTSLEEDDTRTLHDTISQFINVLRKEQRYWKREGIRNINFALLNIQMSAYNRIRKTLKEAGEWYDRECEIWQGVIERAIASGEIKEVDPELLAHTIEDLYLGAAYAGIPNLDGYDLDYVERQLMFIYDCVKK